MKTTEQLLADLMRANHRRRTATLLTDVLMMGLHIPVGAQLVLVLGDGCARDNRDAVYGWVLSQLDELGSLSPLQVKSTLASRLYRRLMDAQTEILVQ
jgi:hypothetical protein